MACIAYFSGETLIFGVIFVLSNEKLKARPDFPEDVYTEVGCLY